MLLDTGYMMPATRCLYLGSQILDQNCLTRSSRISFFSSYKGRIRADSIHMRKLFHSYVK